MKRRQEAAEEAERQRLQAEADAKAVAEAEAEAARQAEAAARDAADAPGSPAKEHESGEFSKIVLHLFPFCEIPISPNFPVLILLNLLEKSLI